ncbi:hypothetical protein [Qipengyuania oceanensis]|uniref:Uncharacterized protein n=1 Tax=Qipengyuania oceanensis TaxID=1463597 RepID=A0A844Y953_9SPHN|nr:hypothetical protein [Qipengyuania oceanensis]MXO61396.1 hypothetical protein [Qipengyuania oceanensis]
MKLQLFEILFVGADIPHETCIVATDQARAEAFLRDHFEALGLPQEPATLRRIDGELDGDERLGLDGLLMNAPIGLASFCKPVGWMTHTGPVHRLKLYRIDTMNSETLVIAPNPDVALFLASSQWDLSNGRQIECTIHDGILGLADEQIPDMERTLEFGPIGFPVWDGDGWQVDTY